VQLEHTLFEVDAHVPVRKVPAPHDVVHAVHSRSVVAVATCVSYSVAAHSWRWVAQTMADVAVTAAMRYSPAGHCAVTATHAVLVVGEHVPVRTKGG
jgi:hypothetical protein